MVTLARFPIRPVHPQGCTPIRGQSSTPMGWTPLRRHLCAKVAALRTATKGEASMEKVTIIGLDLAKSVFQSHGARSDGSVAFRMKISRVKLLAFFASRNASSPWRLAEPPHRVNTVDLKNRLCYVETDCFDRLHEWLLRIVAP
jgi:hypothetical protein